MAEEKKTTIMWIKVDLQCHRCRKKIKKVLCKIPQIQDQLYDEKGNYVIIKVVCCSPEKVKQKIICKGGVTIKSIEIKEPEKKTEPPPKKENPQGVPAEHVKKPPETGKTRQKKDPEPVFVPVRPTCCTECSEGHGGGPCLYGPGTRPWPPLTPKLPLLVPVYPSGFRTCCTECSEGRGGGPCHYGQGRPPPCYDGYYYGRPIYDSYGGGYRCEETSYGCTIM
ncbi:protein PYRICULARIA ORYZAE RESISTANCE 21-like [Quercus lobata]|uniref:Uncharacterized protein n=1 Tax=Quercus lobata TaxID=97700 RepID=A0A7N2R5E3_QUELO|nr:protein PYRICULARIA ORYZAE RESISTANCE 21-like [Quercus lobata]